MMVDVLWRPPRIPDVSDLDGQWWGGMLSEKCRKRVKGEDEGRGEDEVERDRRERTALAFEGVAHVLRHLSSIS
jgi:hypothetical protein